MTPAREAFDRNKQPRTPRRRAKFCHVGVPTIFKLELACCQIAAAFCGGRFGHCYLVGSALERPDFRDVDIVCILDDADFRALFPAVVNLSNASWENDPRWLLMTVMLCDWLSAQAGGILVDFKFQPMSFANARHAGARQPIGFCYVKGATE